MNGRTKYPMKGANDDEYKQTKNMFFHITIDNLVCVTNHNIISEV